MGYPVYQVPAGQVVPIMFDTFAGATGASITLTGLAVTDIEVYKNGSATQRASDAGFSLLDTDGIDFDGITGIHGFSIDTGDNTDAGFYTVGAWFHVVVSSVTIDGQTVSFIAAAFRIMAAEGVAGVPDVNVTHVADTAQTAGDIVADTNDIQSRLPAALVSGRMDASVGAMAANTLTASALASDAVTEIQSGLATSAALATVDGKVDTIDATADAILVDTAEIGVAGAGLTALASAANLATVAGYLDTEIAAILADTNELQTDWANGGRLDLILDARASQASVDTIQTTVDKLDDLLVNSSDGWIFTVAALQDAPTGGGGGSAPTAGEIADAVWDEALAGHAGGGSAGAILSARASQTSVDDLPTNSELATALASSDDAVLAVLGSPAGASLAADIAAVQADTAEIGAAGAGLTALASATNLAVIAGYLDTEIAAIKAKTDNLPASPAATGDIPSAAAIADAVHDEVVEGAVTLRQSIRLHNAVLAGKASGLATTEVTYRDLGDTTDRVVATVDADGNRSAVSRSLG